ncbi:unnamed protein product, partial [Iphiclides podalirius]
MDFRSALLVGLFFLITIAAFPSGRSEVDRSKRDVMESMKNAWGDMVKTLGEAGDAVVHVFKPTEKSTIDKMVDSVKSVGQ